MRAIQWSICLLLSGACIAISCTKSETILISDNDPPIVNNVPAIKIENYVNRVFIDLLGREPLDSEMETESNALRNADLSEASRLALIEKLQTGTDFIEGDTSYQRAYHQQFYNLAKVHFLEGVSDPVIRIEYLGQEDDSLQIILLENLLDSREGLQEGTISISDFFGSMIHNRIYDQINMNTFNFVNATFDNLYWRFPTDTEFQAGFDMVEFSVEESFLGEMGTDKYDYVDIITNSLEFYEGLIILVYQQLLARRPETSETAALLIDFANHQDIRLIQRAVMITDEYAGF